MKLWTYVLHASIGTIGHVAHGKSTVVKAVSGVQTVRFKNELERNITIKLDPTGAAVKIAGALPVSVDSIQKQQVSESDGKSVGLMGRKADPAYKQIFNCNGFVDEVMNLGCKASSSNRNRKAKKRKKGDSCLTQCNTKMVKKLPASLTTNEKVSKSKCCVYEVEKIIDYRNINDKPMYLIKWKGWASRHNTWEPYENLTNCTRLLCKFFEHSPNENHNRSTKELERLRDILCGTVDQQNKLLVKYRNKNGWLSLPKKVHRKETEMLLNSLAKLVPSQRDPELVKRVSRELMLIALLDRRSIQLKALKEWEEEMNTVSHDSACLKVENNYDLEGPPLNFMYITDYIPGENVTIPDDPPFGCDCQPSCSIKMQNCCGRSLGTCLAYNAFKKLRVKLGTPIYECNKRCKCGPDCINRVVQNGRKVKLCIFKTNTNCGWGVKTLEKIKKGTFVTVYVGEVITSEEAERRGKIYDQEGRTYLFDLDYNEKDQCPYTVDAALLGNISHFINHSCDPNLEVFAVWINCLDPNIPKLAMFSCRDIGYGEEITFDYLCHTLCTENGHVAVDDSVDGNNRVLCGCRSSKCRQFLF